MITELYQEMDVHGVRAPSNTLLPILPSYPLPSVQNASGPPTSSSRDLPYDPVDGPVFTYCTSGDWEATMPEEEKESEREGWDPADAL